MSDGQHRRECEHREPPGGGEAHEDASEEEDEVGEEDGEGHLQWLQHAHDVGVAALDQVSGAHPVEEGDVLKSKVMEGERR